MAYNLELASRIREYMLQFSHLNIEEKKMFRGLTFMVNGKMCVSVSGENMMCRFDPAFQVEVSKKKGFQIMKMRGREYRGYCYVSQEGIKAKDDFEYWLKLCIGFNEKAKASKKNSKNKAY